MGSQKHFMERQQAKRDAALRIALGADALAECPFHEGQYFDGDVDVQKAYIFGNVEIKKPEYEGIFDSSRDMTDTVLAVYNDNSGVSRCPSCPTFGGDED